MPHRRVTVRYNPFTRVFNPYEVRSTSNHLLIRKLYELNSAALLFRAAEPFASTRPKSVSSSSDMATPGATLPHRAVSSIRGGAVPTTVSTSSSSSPAGGPGDNPRTPLRSVPNVPSAFNSPSALRAEDEILVVEFGARKLRVGFAGDPVPKGLVVFSPPQARRVGDFRAWDVGHVDDWRANERDGWG